jgi:hypothetical protein
MKSILAEGKKVSCKTQQMNIIGLTWRKVAKQQGREKAHFGSQPDIIRIADVKKRGQGAERHKQNFMSSAPTHCHSCPNGDVRTALTT